MDQKYLFKSLLNLHDNDSYDVLLDQLRIEKYKALKESVGLNDQARIVSDGFIRGLEFCINYVDNAIKQYKEDKLIIETEEEEEEVKRKEEEEEKRKQENPFI